MYYALDTIRCALYIVVVHHTLYTLHFAQCIPRCPLFITYTIHYQFSTLHSTPYVGFGTYTTHATCSLRYSFVTPLVMRAARCIHHGLDPLSIIHATLHNAHCAIPTTPYVRYTLYTISHTLHTMHHTSYSIYTTSIVN